MITPSDEGKSRKPASPETVSADNLSSVTTEPKVIRWQADPERRAACGPITGSGAAVVLRATVGQSQ